MKSHFPTPYGLDVDDNEFEYWQIDEKLLEKKDYKGLLKFRQKIAAQNPDNGYVFIRLGEAYILNGEYDKAIELLGNWIKGNPDHPALESIQYIILDALFASGKDEHDFDWLLEPVIIRLNNESLDQCYEFLKRQEQPSDLYALYKEFAMQGYVRFTQEELQEALNNDERFVLGEYHEVSLKAWPPDQEQPLKKTRNAKIEAGVEEIVIGYSAYHPFDECYEYNENACYIADTPESLREFLSDALWPVEEYRIDAVTITDIEKDYGESEGEYALEPDALEQFKQTAAASDIEYTVTPYDPSPNAPPTLYIVNIKD